MLILNSPVENGGVEGIQLQLDMFSDRSCEWWEAGNRLNTGSGTYEDSKHRHLVL